MEYRIKTLTIKELLVLFNADKLDLKPYYQRNDIWSKNDQDQLIESIRKGYPLPNFFIYERRVGFYELVDGQQRTRTIIRYIQNSLDPDIKETFLSYKLSITEIYNIQDDRELEEFYVLVNKKGKHLTTPELHKAEYSQTNFLRCVEELLDYQNFVNLNLFSEAASKRMNDRNFIEELVAYLIYGVQDKKKIIEKIYEKDISEEQKEEIERRFKRTSDRINFLNEIHALSKTRYKQRNDFYTLFNFVHQNIEESDDLLKAQYKVLLAIGPHISPSIDGSTSLRDYAINCVSQSNSKNARNERLHFFNSVLLNKYDIAKNPILLDVCNYIDRNNLFDLDFVSIEEFYLIKG